MKVATPARPLGALDLPVTGMRCASCAAGVEGLLRAVPGAGEVTVNFATRQAHLAQRVDLATLQQALERGGYGVGTRETQIFGVTDPGSLRTLEGVLEVTGAPGVTRVVHLDHPQVLEALRERAGEAARMSRVRSAMQHEIEAETVSARRRVLLGALPTLLLLLGGMEPSRSWLPGALTEPLVQAALASFVWLVTGGPILGGAWRALRHGRADMNTLVALGAGSAFVLSWVRALGSPSSPAHLYFETAAVILELVCLGRWMESRARHRMGDALDALGERAPQSALLLVGEDETRAVHPSELLGGDLVRVLPGQAFPADGEVVRGNSSADEALLTGESLPVAKHLGDGVHAGTLNGRGALAVRVTAAGAGTLLARIAQQVAAAQGSRAPIARLADRVAGVFVPIVLALAALTFLAWWMVQGARGLEPGLLAAVSVLLIACPCALGLATPTALVVGIGRAARRGILFRDGETLERAAAISGVCLDKTGTLTVGRPQVIEMLPIQRSEEELLGLCAAVEQGSEHPLAGAVLRAAAERGLAPLPSSAHSSSPGLGARATVKNRDVWVGNAAYLAPHPVALRALAFAQEKADQRGATLLLASVDGQAAGALLLRDEPRPEADRAVNALKALDLRVVVLSGDRAAAVAAVARELGIQEHYGSLTPMDKGAWIAQQAQERFAMVGDGVNDAPALAAAHVGVSVRGASDVARSAAGIALLDADLLHLPEAVALARRTLLTIRQNLFWAFAYNAVGIPIAALGWLDPMLAAAAMAASSLCVVGNSLRLARVPLRLGWAS